MNPLSIFSLVICLFIVKCKSSLYILDTNSLSDI